MGKFSDKINSYFELQQSSISKYFNPDLDYKYMFSINNNHQHIIDIFNNNNKLLLKAEYEFAGVYNINSSIWHWAWNLDFINRQLARSSLVTKKFARYIKDHLYQFDPLEADDLYFRTNNGYYYTSSKNILLIVKLILYLTKSLWFLSICNHNDNSSSICKHADKNVVQVQYLLIKKILQVG